MRVKIVLSIIFLLPLSLAYADARVIDPSSKSTFDLRSPARACFFSVRRKISSSLFSMFA